MNAYTLSTTQLTACNCPLHKVELLTPKLRITKTRNNNHNSTPGAPCVFCHASLFPELHQTQLITGVTQTKPYQEGILCSRTRSVPLPMKVLTFKFPESD